MLYTGPNLERKTKGAASFDLVADRDYVIPRFKSCTIRTGTCVALPKGSLGLLTLRSGHGFHKNLLCHIGIIDSDYRGEIAVKVFNMDSDDASIGKNERFAQLTVIDCPIVYPVSVESLDETERGRGGFGSTGLK